ncbi:hypothetical protein KCP78_23750 [Salmonella enterica subsp. enterica]|nr:hypothetical protein KCP78_23750 [Salmonella enterica subsp. enterica]
MKLDSGTDAAGCKQQELQKQTAPSTIRRKTIQLTSQLAEEERSHSNMTSISPRCGGISSGSDNSNRVRQKYQQQLSS